MDENIIAAIINQMPGWIFSVLPIRFGWTPDRHYRAVLTNGELYRPVVIRRCWNTEGFQRELYLYQSVLPRLPIITPALWATFCTDQDNTCWMVMEDLGEITLSSTNAEHRQRFFAVLGTLHGATGRTAYRPVIPVFAPDVPPYQGWVAAMTDALHNPEFHIEAWMPELAIQLLLQLATEPMVLLHGDTDWSNAILRENGAVGLIDWERAQIGPAALDLGRPAGMIASSTELTAYHHAYCHASGTVISAATVMRWVTAGEYLDCARWVAYFITATTAGNSPGEDWKARYYDSSIKRMSELRTFIQE